MMRFFLKAGVSAVICACSFMAAPAAVGAAGGKSDQAKFAGWLSSVIEEKVRAELEGPGREVKSVEAYVPARLKEPGDFDSFKITIPKQNRRGDSLFVNVLFTRNERPALRTNVMARIEMLVEAVVASHDIERGRTLREDDVRIEKIRVGVGYSNLAVGLSEVVGLQINRNARAGTPLMAAWLDRPKTVRAGDIVTITADSGAMRITALGRAKQDGDLGEWIRVVNIDSKKVINAVIAGPGKVRVEF